MRQYCKALSIVPVNAGARKNEEVGCIRADLFVTREEAEVGIHARGERIVIPRAQVNVPAHNIAFAADHQCDFGMDLEPDRP